MQFFFVGDIRSGKSILDEIRKMGTLVGLAVSDRNLEQASEVDVSILKEATLNTPEGIEKLRDLSIDVLINFNSLTIFSSASLSSLKIGGVNFHPGLLPEYSGSNVHQWAILNGEKSTGVSIHVMNEKVDSGAVLSQSFVDIGDKDTGLTLYMKLLREGSMLMGDTLQGIKNNNFDFAVPQNLLERRFYTKTNFPVRKIDFSNTAEQVNRLVRALNYRPMLSPLGHAYVEGVHGAAEFTDLKITNEKVSSNIKPGMVIDVTMDQVKIACSDLNIIFESAWTNNAKVKAGIAAEKIGLKLGRCV